MKIPKMIREVKPRPISHAQLLYKVEQIYAGLCQLEARCIEVDRQYVAAMETHSAKRTELECHQWHALISLHEMLIHEHIDFFLVIPHPDASPTLTRLGANYGMPERLWRHGIHAFLEVFRTRLPDSRDHALRFLHIAYSLLTFLHETIPTFKMSWIEILGDLARYGIVCNLPNKVLWVRIVNSWYLEAVDKHPGIGRLYHHIAVLVQPGLQRLYRYTQSPTSQEPFVPARGNETFTWASENAEAYSFEKALVRIHEILFVDKQVTKEAEKLFHCCTKGGPLEQYVLQRPLLFQYHRIWIAIISIAVMLEYQRDLSLLRYLFAKAWTEKHAPVDDQQEVFSLEDVPDPTRTDMIRLAQRQEIKAFMAKRRSHKFAPSRELRFVSNLNFTILSTILRLRSSGENTYIYPYMLVEFCFISNLARVPEAIRVVESDNPKDEIRNFLNRLILKRDKNSCMAGILPEHMAMQGQQWYSPSTDTEKVPKEWSPMDLPSHVTDLINWIVYYGLNMPVSKNDFRVKYHEADIFSEKGLIDYDKSKATFSAKHATRVVSRNG